MEYEIKKPDYCNFYICIYLNTINTTQMKA